MRWPVAIAASVLVLGACTSGDGGGDDDAAPTTARPATEATTTTSTSLPASAEQAVHTSGRCPGIGAAPSADAPVLTWTVGRDVVHAGGCLVELERPAERLEWGGRGDRLLVDGHVAALAAGEPTTVAAEVTARGSLSRPTGTSILHVHRDRGLEKLKVGDVASPVALSFLSDVTAALYHPAGRSLVAAGKDGSGREGVFIADNQGQGGRLLVDGAEAGHLTVREFAWTATGALLFAADHDGTSHLHRLEIGEDEVATALEVPLSSGGVRNLVASPFAGGGVAAMTGDCDVWASRGGAVVGTGGLRGRPVGWLPDGVLAVITSCDGPGDLVTVEVQGRSLAGAPEVVATGVSAAAVRAILPTAPEPPPVVPDAAPA
ncbi:MAG TPA: hypothetical protein VF230_18200 [Acidimicrobiales bacterium]